MSTPREPQPAKLISGLLFRDFSIRNEALAAMCDHFGPLDFLMEAQPFTYTSYYEKEMGNGIYRQVCSFTKLVRPDALPDIKHWTNKLEGAFLVEGRRQVNVDPGLLCEERLVLATGKNFTHRIYLRDGFYADLTLIYQKGGFQCLPWTYPDYREPRLRVYLSGLRRKLIFQRRGSFPRSTA